MSRRRVVRGAPVAGPVGGPVASSNRLVPSLVTGVLLPITTGTFLPFTEWTS